MLDNFLKKDRNEELEKILENKEISEQAKNLLQSILYKIDISYKDYKKVKTLQTTKSQYIEELLRNIKKKCRSINTIKLSEKLEGPELQDTLKKNKFYIVDNKITCYPIETKLLYAIERLSNNKRIVNSRYGISSIALSNLLNRGKCMDRVEPLRDFNGWSWTTVKSELESIISNLVYQTLQILLGEEFLNEWSNDTDGIIDYISLMQDKLIKKYGEESVKRFLELLYKISIIDEIELNNEYRKALEEELANINTKIAEYEDTKSYIENYSNKKKQAADEIKDIEKILSQESSLKEEYQKRNSKVELSKKIFSIKVLKQQLIDRKNLLLNEIEESNYYLNPQNFVFEKNKLKNQKELIDLLNYNEEEKTILLIEFEKIFLNWFEESLEKEQTEKIIKQIYQLRYYMFLPFDDKKSIKDLEELKNIINKIKNILIKTAIDKKVIVSIPKDIVDSIFGTRIMILEDLYFKIEQQGTKYYAQIFDENVTEQRIQIDSIKSMKINKKIQIFN